MQINISGRHGTIDAAMEEYAREKAEKLGKFFSGIQHVDIVMEPGGNKLSQVESSVVLGQGARLVGKAESEDLKAAIDQADSKLTKQVRRFHAKLKAHRDRTRVTDGVPTQSEDHEATYEQVVREMLEEDVH